MNSLSAFLRQVFRYIRTVGYFIWMLLPQMFSHRTSAKLCEIVTKMEEPKFKWVEGRWYHEDPPKVIHSETGTVFENHPKCRIRIFEFWHFPSIFDLSGNSVWPQKLCQIGPFLAFLINFCPLKIRRRSSLRSQCWTRLFLWFSNTVK